MRVLSVILILFLGFFSSAHCGSCGIGESREASSCEESSSHCHPSEKPKESSSEEDAKKNSSDKSDEKNSS